MARFKSNKSAAPQEPSEQKVNLRELADHLGLSVATVSLVMNRSPAAKSIPHHTQARVRAAARELNYRPNVMARMLRQQRSFTIGVIVPEISEGYAALVLSGIEDHLLQEGYFYFVVSHRHRNDLIEEYPRLLQQRAVEGLILVDTLCQSGIHAHRGSGSENYGRRQFDSPAGQRIADAAAWLRRDLQIVANSLAIHRAFCVQRHFRPGGDSRAKRSGEESP